MTTKNRISRTHTTAKSPSFSSTNAIKFKSILFFLCLFFSQINIHTRAPNISFIYAAPNEFLNQNNANSSILSIERKMKKSRKTPIDIESHPHYKKMLLTFEWQLKQSTIECILMILIIMKLSEMQRINESKQYLMMTGNQTEIR